MNLLYVYLSTLLVFGSCKQTGENIKQDNAADNPPVDQTELPTEAADEPEQVPMVYLLMKTTAGDITLELDPNRAPVSVANFMRYVEKDQYDSTIFHRVMADFVIQGGGYTPDGTEKPTDAPIILEDQNGLTNAAGTIAMARTNAPNSATSQFYINVKDNNMLNGGSGRPGYAVFGRVIEGMDVVNKIRTAQTKSHQGHQNWPVDPVIILDVVKVED